ncbi:MAG: hypothetical protein RIQ94_2021 [Pseudomonadota bacterium]
MIDKIRKTQSAHCMGVLLLNAGKISASDAERIISLQKKNDIRFGEAAKALGLISDDDIQEALSHQFDFLFLGANEDNFSRELIAAYQPFCVQVEALRTLREQLLLRWFTDVHNTTLALVSLNHDEGCSRIAANLAVVFSQIGKRTLLIDANLRQPQQQILFQLQGGYGLSDVLAGRADLTVINRISSLPNLSVLLAGSLTPNSVDLISRGLKSCLLQLQKQFDVILIDTPSAEQGMDAQIIASLCHASLLVVRRHKTHLNNLQLLKESLQSTGGQCLGAVLTDF